MPPPKKKSVLYQKKDGCTRYVPNLNLAWQQLRTLGTFSRDPAYLSTVYSGQKET